MKKNLICAAVLAITSVAGVAETKQNSRPGTIEIPFEFRVQNERMPAGTYNIKNAGASFVVLRNLETGREVWVLSNEQAHNGKKQLRFKHVGEDFVIERVS